MENFIFENSTKAFFGKKCVTEYLPDLLRQYGDNVLLAYGGGSIKRNGIYEEIAGILKAAVLHPPYYRHIYKDGLPKFVRFATEVWGIDPRGKTDEEVALAGVEALAAFIKEIGLPTTLWELGVKDKKQAEEIADTCFLSPGSYRKLTREDIRKIFAAAY